MSSRLHPYGIYVRSLILRKNRGSALRAEARTDFAAIESNLDVIKSQLTGAPRRSPSCDAVGAKAIMLQGLSPGGQRSTVLARVGLLGKKKGIDPI